MLRGIEVVVQSKEKEDKHLARMYCNYNKPDEKQNNNDNETTWRNRLVIYCYKNVLCRIIYLHFKNLFLLLCLSGRSSCSVRRQPGLHILRKYFLCAGRVKEWMRQQLCSGGSVFRVNN